jgi:chemotaxis protein CheX
VDAAQTVLEQVLSERTNAGEPQLSSKTVAGLGVATIVGITGEAEGRLLIDMSRDSALGIAAVMNGREWPELDSLGQDTLAELASMITGRAISTLNDAGHRLSVSPPTILIGENLIISGLDLETLVVPLQTSQGEVVVNIAVTTN